MRINKTDQRLRGVPIAVRFEIGRRLFYADSAIPQSARMVTAGRVFRRWAPGDIGYT